MVTPVACPCALNVTTGTAEAEPYVVAVTPVLEMLNVVAGERFKPVPAVYVIGALNCRNVMAVVPTVIGKGVC